jgi:tRNA nucleotidyltransferase/poly(A) polymerase
MNALVDARFVGGCVRNALLGLAVDDIDIATPLTPDEVSSRVEAQGMRAVATGLEHGTLTIICNSRPFEVTTLRRDVSTDGRRASIAFTKDWAEDAARRDFTINALYADAAGKVFDYQHGLEDRKTICVSCGCFAFMPGMDVVRSTPLRFRLAKPRADCCPIFPASVSSERC